MSRPASAARAVSTKGALPAGAILATLGNGLLALVVSWSISAAVDGSYTYLTRVAVIYATVMTVALSKLREHHRHGQFGAANWVTTLRAALTSVVVGGLGETGRPELALALALVGTAAVVLDGLDGRLARRSALTSAFGARFDMEVDALLILALTIVVWVHGKAGLWILVSGLLRYAFVAASWVLAWMRRPLPASRRRQAVCVVQIVALLVVLAPWVSRPWSDTIAAASVVLLCYSFYIDVRWLWRAAPQAPPAH